MNVPTFSFATFTALAFMHVVTPFSAHADTDNRTIAIESNEFRYDKPFSATQTSKAELDTTASRTQSKLAAIEKGVQSVKLDKQQREHKHIGTVKNARDNLLSSVNEFWIYESFVTLDNDLDYDGFHSTFSIEFDADTIFASAPVYAVLYVGKNGLYDAIHVSSEFFIYGEDATDSFTIESTLVSGFPTDDYDLLLELYDADTEALVAFTDGYDDNALALLPLESKNNEYVVEETVVIVEEHGGSSSLFSLLLIFTAFVFRAIKKH